MNSPNDDQNLFIRIRAEWVLLTDDDVREGVKRRETLLERLQHRHNFGLDEAHAQLHAFEQKNPELLFETS
jgi:hypothetical protein